MIRRSAKLAEEFAAALEGRGVASARRDPALAPLLQLAQGLEAVPLAPAAEFRDALRQRLMAVAGVAPAPVAVETPLDRARRWVEGWRVQKAMAATAASMAAVVALTGVSIGASRSLPGDPLYGVKRSTEGVQLSLARNDVNRGKRHLQHAETRLDEIAKVVGEDLVAVGPAPVAPGQITVAFGGSKSEKVAGALRDMDDSTRTGTRLLFEAYTEQRDDDVLRVVQTFTDRQRTNLRSLIDDLPTQAAPAASASLNLVVDLHVRATQLLAVGTCGENCPPPISTPPSPGATATPTAPTPSPTFDELGPVPCTTGCDAPDGNATPTPEPTPTPQPSPTPEPTESGEPTPEPTTEPTPEPTPTSTSPTPRPSPTRYPVPSPVPSPVASPIQDVIKDIEKVVGTPLPTPPLAPQPQVPPAMPVKP